MSTIEALQDENARLHTLLEQQQQQTKAAEQRYRHLFETLTIGAFITDLQGNFQESNPLFQKIVGYSDNELPSLSLPTLTPEKWHSKDQEIQQTALFPHGSTDVYQKELIGKDGTIIPVEIQCTLITNEQGEPTGIRGFVRDITTQQQQERELRSFKSLVENALDAVGYSDEQGNYLYVNPTYQAMTGYGEKMIDMSVADLFDPNVVDIYAVIQEIMTEGKWQGIMPFTRKDQTIFQGQCSIYKVEEQGGDGFLLAAIVRDITEQLRVEQELSTFKMLLDNALDAVGYSDEQGNFIYVNPIYQAMTGYGEEMIGMSVADLYDPHVVDIYAVIQEIMTEGQWQGVMPFTRKDQTIFQGQSSIYKVEKPGGDGFLLAAIVRDITEQLRVEQELSTFKMLVDRSPDGINVTTTEAEIFYANESFRALSGYKEEVIGKTIVDLYADDPQTLMTGANEVVEKGSWNGPLTILQPDGTLIPVMVTVFAIPDDQGNANRLAAIVRDLSEQQKQEQERQELQQQIIAAQQAALRELSTPLLPLAKGILAMPLLGTIDSNRAQMVMETLLEGVSAYQAETVILDITGVQMVDTQVANVLIQAAQAVKLLGAQVVLTGIRPMMAQTLVSLGVDLSSIVTRSTLENGIAYALND